MEKRKILLVDDDTSLLLTLSDFLVSEGYDVVRADSGEQGLKKLEQMTPHLIILDMSMPGMGGIGFLKEISSDTGKPKHPVLVLTARANMAEFFADVEVDGFVAKPCNPDDLLMEVSRIIFLRSGDVAEETSEIEEGTIEKKKVLIADDDSNIMSLLVSAFSEEGFDVKSVSRGPEVLESAIVEHPDIIVIKLVLEGMNGDIVANMLKEMPNTKDIPVVLYDDTDTSETESKYKESGAKIKKFVSGHNSVNLLSAVKGILGSD